MHRYTEFDQRFVDERVAPYREQTRRHLTGEVTDDAFRQLRLHSGLYIQPLAPMLRVAVPYGTLSSTRVRAFTEGSPPYDRGCGHLTTRQNIRFNRPALEAVPDILADLAEV